MVRATFGAFTPALNDIAAFVEELAQQIEVPDESLFMARLGKQWRDETDL